MLLEGCWLLDRGRMSREDLKDWRDVLVGKMEVIKGVISLCKDGGV